MFRNSENWVIVIDACNNIDQELWQLYKIYCAVHHVKMVDYYDAYTILQYHIQNLEEKMHRSNPKLNGDAIEVGHSFIPLDDFDEAREGFGNDKRFRDWMIDHIHSEHDEIDQLADYIPKMLKYYKSLVDAAKRPLVKRTISSTSPFTSTWADVKDQFISMPSGEPVYLTIPQLNLYHIDTRPTPETDPYDDYLEMIANCC